MYFFSCAFCFLTFDRGITFYSDRTGRNEVYTTKADGSDLKQVTDH